MDVDEKEEGFVDVGTELSGAVCCGDPGGGGDARVDYGVEPAGAGGGVGSEEFCFDLGQDIFDCFGLFGKFDGEVGFELID